MEKKLNFEFRCNTCSQPLEKDEVGWYCTTKGCYWYDDYPENIVQHLKGERLMVDVDLSKDEIEFINFLMQDLVYSNYNIKLCFESETTQRMICSIKNKTTKVNGEQG